MPPPHVSNPGLSVERKLVRSSHAFADLVLPEIHRFTDGSQMSMPEEENWTLIPASPGQEDPRATEVPNHPLEPFKHIKGYLRSVNKGVSCTRPNKDLPNIGINLLPRPIFRGVRSPNIFWNPRRSRILLWVRHRLGLDLGRRSTMR